MTSYLRTRLHFLIGLAGCIVFVFGVFILASGIKIRELLTGDFDYFGGFGKNTCQYWAGIPIIVTGGVLVLTALLNRHQALKYISVYCVLTAIVLAVGVMIEESTNATLLHKNLQTCDDPTVSEYRKKDCDHIKEAKPWYYILLYATDLVLVLCSFVMLLLFADWILFVAPKTMQSSGQLAQEVFPPCQQAYDNQPGNHQGATSLYPVCVNAEQKQNF